jgi:hypothetical protein
MTGQQCLPALSAPREEKRFLFAARARRLGAVILAGLVAGLPLLAPSAGASRAAGARRGQEKAQKGGEVHGVALMSVPGRESPFLIPDLDLVLIKADGGQVVESVKTDLFGRFVFPRQVPGKYKVRLGGKAWGEAEVSEAFTIDSETVFLPPTELKPPTRDGAVVLCGRVRLADGGSPFTSQEFFGVLQTADVTARHKDDKPLQARVNAYGEYVLVGVKKQPLRVQAALEKARSVTAEVPETAFRDGVAVLPTLEIENRRPQVRTLKALVDEKQVYGVRGDTVVRCVAHAVDQDGHALTYTWKDPLGTDRLRAKNDSAEWTLPKIPGTYRVYVLVSDGYGGYATGQLSIVVGDKELAAPLTLTLAEVPPAPGEFLTFKGPGSNQLANGYYATIDPMGKRKTLGEWWTVNGFDQTGSAAGEVKAAYLNNNDLGFGREMHILKTGDRVAAYVTNYGDSDQKAENADAAQAGTSPVATVCMEYSPIDGGSTPIVKFYVYAPGKAPGSPRSNSANLDGVGDKFVPNLCMNCHGGAGSYTTANPTPNDVNLGASFREFDLATYRFPRPGTPANDPSRDTPTPGEKKAFHDLNNLVLATQPQLGIQQLVAGWYKKGGDDQDNNYVPPGWAGNPERDLYLNVVRHSCRTCHVAFGSSATPNGLTWLTFDQFKGHRPLIGYYALCAPKLVMPHAKTTFNNFWNSPSTQGPDFLRNFETTGWTKIGLCR